jgi:alkylhydroperoxidase family enzyme
VDSHGFFLRSQGGDEVVVQALSRGELAAAPVTDSERALLRLVEAVTRHAYRTTDADVEALRQCGWTDPQIAEAVYVTALFAFFNRVADAFGIDSQGYGGPRPAFPGAPDAPGA